MSAETTAAIAAIENNVPKESIIGATKHEEGLNQDLTNDFEGNSINKESGPLIERTRHHYDSYEEDETSAISSPYMIPIQVPQTPEYATLYDDLQEPQKDCD